MKLSEVFSQLTFGELKQINIGGYDTGTITPANYKEIVNHINLGVLDLYGKFPLKESHLILRTKADKLYYQLIPANAFSSNPNDYFIVDTLAEPFTGDILQIQKVHDSKGDNLPINDATFTQGLKLTGYNTLMVPWTVEDSYVPDEELTVYYKSKPQMISVPTPSSLLDLARDVPIPDALLEGLLLFVEYRVHKSKGGQDGLAQAVMARQNYEAFCLNMASTNFLNNATAVTNNKPLLNGWEL